MHTLIALAGEVKKEAIYAQTNIVAGVGERKSKESKTNMLVKRGGIRR